MESIAQPLRRLQEEGAWFARARELRLLWVAAQAALRATALTCCSRFEYHADNRSLYVVAETPWNGERVRALSDAFVQRFEEKAQGLRRAGIEVGGFARVEGDEASWAGFGHALRRACEALRPPLQGITVVLAPSRVEDAAAFVNELRALVAASLLQDVRWIVIESDSRHQERLLRELGPGRALGVEFRIDEAQQQRDLAALVGPLPAEGSPPALPPPWGPWASRGAMPRVTAPRRSDDRAPASDEQLRANGLSPAYVKGGGQELQRLMLLAALALRQGRLGDAIELQARTAALCGRLELPREQVIHLLVLGGYQLAAAQSAQARASYRAAAELAVRGELPLQAAQAELGLGMLEALEQRPEALQHYAQAAQLSERAQLTPLAIECWRMAGQFASEHRAHDRAIECWRRGWELVGTLDEVGARATSAATIANLLAQQLLARGQGKEARELQRRAFVIEHGTEPGAEPAVR
jgi:tetratricopeptide (TPR) repeat protein